MRPIDYSLPSMPFFSSVMTPPYAQHGVYSKIHIRPLYRKYGDIARLRLHLRQPSGLLRLIAHFERRL